MKKIVQTSNCIEVAEMVGILYKNIVRDIKSHVDEMNGFNMEQDILQKKQSFEDRFHIREMNARSRMAQMYMKLAQVDTLSSTYKNILVAKASEVLAGEKIIPLPVVTQRKTYSAREIGEMFGISANKVGRIANQHTLKKEPFGEYRIDTKKYTVGECNTWVYFDTVIPEFVHILVKTGLQRI